jgi:hypothetical protein
MATGDSNDIVSRVKRLLPTRWFNATAPYRDAVLGGIADAMAWAYSLVGYAQAQSRLQTSVGFMVDLFAYDYLGIHLLRRPAELDSMFVPRIQKEIFRERVTRHGMFQALKDLTGNDPIIIEPWFEHDCGGWSSRTTNTIIPCWGWSTGNAKDQARAGWVSGPPIHIGQTDGLSTSWGSRTSNNQVWITVFRPTTGQGVPNAGGWSGRTNFQTLGGWASRLASILSGSAMEWASRAQITGIVTDQDIYNTINLTKPTGYTVWVQLLSTSVVTPIIVAPPGTPALIFSNAPDSQYIGVGFP